jgi:hypothetical protein
MTKTFKVLNNSNIQTWIHVKTGVIFTIKISDYLHPNYLTNITVPNQYSNNYEDIIRDFLLVFIHRGKNSLEGFSRDIITIAN